MLVRRHLLKMHGSSMFGIEEANNLGDFLGMTGKEKLIFFYPKILTSVHQVRLQW